MKKTMIVFIAVFLLLIGIVFADSSVQLNFSQEDQNTVYSNKDVIAHFRMKDIRQDPFTASPGENIDIYLGLENVGGKIENPQFIFNLKYPFSIDPSTLNDNFPPIGAGEKVTLHYKLRVDKNAAPGEYQVEFRSHDSTNKYYPYFFDIKVDDVTSSFDVVLQEVSKDGASVAISNSGKNTANSITISVDGEGDFELLGISSQIIGNLNAGDYTFVSYFIKPKKGFESNVVLNLKLKIDYTDTVGIRRIVYKDISVTMNAQIKKGFGDLNTFVLDGTSATQVNSSSNFFKYATFVLIIVIMGVIIYYKRKKKANDED